MHLELAGVSDYSGLILVTSWKKALSHVAREVKGRPVWQVISFDDYGVSLIAKCTYTMIRNSLLDECYSHASPWARR